MTDSTLVVHELRRDGNDGAECPSDIEVELRTGDSRARAWVHFGRDEQGRLAIRIKSPGERLVLRSEDCSGVLVSVEQLADVHFEAESMRLAMAKVRALKQR